MKKSWVLSIAVFLMIGFIGAWIHLGTDTVTAPVSSEVTQTTSTEVVSVATSSNVVESEVDSSEAKAEPSLRALDVKPWEWVSATYVDGRVLTPTMKGDFFMTFGSGGGVSFETDCNSMSSSYEAYAGGLTFAPIASTKMYCEGSKETEFAALISETKTYRFTEKGELVLLTDAGDSLMFK